MMCCCSYGISHRELIYFHWQGNPILQRTLLGEKRRQVGVNLTRVGWSHARRVRDLSLDADVLKNQPVHRKEGMDGILNSLWGFPYLESTN